MRFKGLDEIQIWIKIINSVTNQIGYSDKKVTIWNILYYIILGFAKGAENFPENVMGTSSPGILEIFQVEKLTGIYGN